MASFGVPRELQQKVLLFGITFALVLRTVFILVGAAAIENFSWVFYLFGAILIYTAYVQARSGGHDGDEDYKENAVLRLARRVLPTTEEYHSDRMTVTLDGKRFITPLAIALIAIGSADIIFAVDSIPAIFGLTQETYLVFAANAFSLLGLRQLFFLIDGLLDRLVYLAYGLAVILGFIGAKLVIHALHTNELPFVNGGEHITVDPGDPDLAVAGGHPGDPGGDHRGQPGQEPARPGGARRRRRSARRGRPASRPPTAPADRATAGSAGAHRLRRQLARRGPRSS